MELETLLAMQRDLMDKIPHGHTIKPELLARVVAGLGIMEETHEYLNAIGVKSWRPDPLPPEKQLEEVVDIMFFFLEIMTLSGFTDEQIIAEYQRKHAVNLERYERAIRGDYGWDDRGKGEL